MTQSSKVTNTWDERYAQDEYVYGKQPNEFFRQQLQTLRPGKILLPAEGEGRNAVFAALQGWDVVAFDSSVEAKRKANVLAQEVGKIIEYQINSFENFNTEEQFDAIGLVYAHNLNRQENHRKLSGFLKKGGIIILEGFSKEQLNYNSGGPKSIEMLFSVDELKSDFESFSSLNIWTEEVELSEGNYHLGKASVVRMVGVK